MNVDRKTFLRSVGLGAAAVLAKSSFSATTGEDALPLPVFDAGKSEEYWQAVRALYPIEDDPLYLNTGGLGPASSPVLQKAANTTRALQRHSETGHDLFEPARVALARFLGVEPDEVCFTRNATEGNSIIAAGLTLKQGDEVIFDSHAHPGGSFPWFNQVRQRGIKVKLFEPDNSSADANLQRIRDLITPRTRVIQISHITCTTGLILPAREIAQLARERGIWSHFDGAQAVGMIPVNLSVIGCDSYAVSGHKWLGGPHETGLLYLRRTGLDAIAPAGIGAYSGELARLPGELAYRAAASRHEYGTRNAAAIVALAEAVRLQDMIGRERIAARGHALASTLFGQFKEIAGLEILSPQSDALRGSMITIRLPRAPAAKFFSYLLKEHKLRCRPVSEQGLEAVRISTHIFNLAADCTRIAAAVRAAASTL